MDVIWIPQGVSISDHSGCVSDHSGCINDHDGCVSVHRGWYQIVIDNLSVFCSIWCGTPSSGIHQCEGRDSPCVGMRACGTV